MLINTGFFPKSNVHEETQRRLPPGQHLTDDFPVLSKGPIPRISKESWKFTISGLAKEISWTWEEFNKLPMIELITDIHCVTKWSKFNTHWKGVSLDTLMKLANISSEATTMLAYTYDEYSTNLPLNDVIKGKAIVAVKYDDEDIDPEHGGPARLLVPHLYFWKSAKWVKGLKFLAADQPGFWEVNGYHNYGDPWKEQRYDFDV